jgi:peroxiredoxin Q/BCP
VEKDNPEVGDEAISFCLPNQENQEICLENFRGKWVILYFYPRDNTSGCTREALDFTSNLGEFEKLNATIIGVSPDTVKSHIKFMLKHQLKVTLLSDPEHRVIEAYGAWGLKKRYGREYHGVIRSTFLINPEGKIEHIWRNVKVKGHVEDVLNTLRELSE